MAVFRKKWLDNWSLAFVISVLVALNTVASGTALAATDDKSVMASERLPTKLELENLLESLMSIDNASFDKNRLDHIFKMKLDGPNDVYDASHRKRGTKSGYQNNVIYIYFEEYDKIDVDSNDNWLIFGWSQDAHASDEAVSVFPSAPDGSCVEKGDIDLLTSRLGWLEVASSNMPDVPRHRNYTRTAKEFMSIWMDGPSRCFGKLEIVHGARTVKLLRDNR